MLSLFGYIRRKTTEAILGGVDDAMSALGADDAEVTVSIPETLRLRLAPPADGDKADKPTAGKKSK